MVYLLVNTILKIRAHLQVYFLRIKFIFPNSPVVNLFFFNSASSLSCGYPLLFDPPFGSIFDESDCLLLESYEGLVAAAIEPFAVDHDGVSAMGCESRFG